MVCAVELGSRKSSKKGKYMQNTVDERNVVIETGKLLQDLNAQDVIVLDLDGKSSIADYFVLATVTSYAQLKGMVNNLRDFFHERNIELKSGNKHLDDDIWILLDCHYFLVHLMTKEARDFYGLEKLWFESKEVPIS
jgi:ribosome-associated protein